MLLITTLTVRHFLSFVFSSSSFSLLLLFSVIVIVIDCLFLVVVVVCDCDCFIVCFISFLFLFLFSQQFSSSISLRTEVCRLLCNSFLFFFDSFCWLLFVLIRVPFVFCFLLSVDFVFQAKAVSLFSQGAESGVGLMEWEPMLGLAIRVI